MNNIYLGCCILCKVPWLKFTGCYSFYRTLLTITKNKEFFNAFSMLIIFRYKKTQSIRNKSIHTFLIETSLKSHRYFSQTIFEEGNLNNFLVAAFKFNFFLSCKIAPSPILKDCIFDKIFCVSPFKRSNDNYVYFNKKQTYFNSKNNQFSLKLMWFKRKSIPLMAYLKDNEKTKKQK